jgi:ubiquitin-conjugating enzyme E2 variant
MSAPNASEKPVSHTGKYWWVELASVVTWFGLFLVAVWRLVPSIAENPWWAMAMVMSGYVAADFLSGFVHWAGDTWGSYKTPIVGRALISGFRDHHVDEKGITRHDFVDTNGNNCLIAIPAMLFLAWVPLENHWVQGGAGFLTATALWTMVTNQIHKWAHQDPAIVPGYLKALQRWRIILSPEHHDRHHAEPYLSHYCITVGWLNPILDGTGFFRGLERAISAVTGAVPREANGEADQYGVYGEAITPPLVSSEPGSSTRKVTES